MGCVSYSAVRAAEPWTAEGADSADHTSEKKRTRLLIVEDEAVTAAELEFLLERYGYEVPEVVDAAEEAVEAANRLRPDLVLMDIRLRGGSDGIEAARIIGLELGIPVVYVTSHSDEAILQRAKMTQAFGYVLKPFDARELRTSIEIALSQHELRCQIARRERWFATTLQSIGDAVVATDVHGAVTFMNSVAEKLTGWTQLEAMGHDLSEVVSLMDERGAPLRSPVNLALERAETVELPPNTALVDRDGRRLTVDDCASPILDSTGTLLGGVMVFRDVSERRRTEELLARAQRLSALGTLAAGIAHEINNPLTYVLANVGFGALELEGIIAELRGVAASWCPPGMQALLTRLEEAQLALREAQEGTERAARIVHSVRTLAQGGHPPLRPIQLAPVLERACKLAGASLAPPLRLIVDLGVTPTLLADDVQLAQVVTNLLVNAAQAVGAGRPGEVRLSARTNAERQAVIEVRDTGCGIPDEVLPKIFDPFFSTKGVGGGMGLGLSICHRIVESFSGTITVETQPGRGSLFRVILPPASTALE